MQQSFDPVMLLLGTRQPPPPPLSADWPPAGVLVPSRSLYLLCPCTHLLWPWLLTLQGPALGTLLSSPASSRLEALLTPRVSVASRTRAAPSPGWECFL